MVILCPTRMNVPVIWLRRNLSVRKPLRNIKPWLCGVNAYAIEVLIDRSSLKWRKIKPCVRKNGSLCWVKAMRLKMRACYIDDSSFRSREIDTFEDLGVQLVG